MEFIGESDLQRAILAVEVCYFLLRQAAVLSVSMNHCLNTGLLSGQHIQGSSIHIAVYKSDGASGIADDFLNTAGCVPHLAFEEDYCFARFRGFQLFEYLCELLICLKLLEFNAVKVLEDHGVARNRRIETNS